MSRVYAKISLDIWGDEKFCRLTPLPPSGQSLWLYLLVGRFRTSIPGLNLNAGIGALSDRLGWRRTAVDKHWQEIEALGMATADWIHGVIWLPQGIAHNPPQNPNVIRGWGKHPLPECDLVRDALAHLDTYIHAHLSAAHSTTFREVFAKPFWEPFGESFDESFREPFEESGRHGSEKQDQDQEQDQDLLPPRTPPPGGLPLSTRKPSASEARWAEQIYRVQGCPHRPPCRAFAICLGKLVMDRRLQIHQGMLDRERLG